MSTKNSNFDIAVSGVSASKCLPGSECLRATGFGQRRLSERSGLPELPSLWWSHPILLLNKSTTHVSLRCCALDEVIMWHTPYSHIGHVMLRGLDAGTAPLLFCCQAASLTEAFHGSALVLIVHKRFFPFNVGIQIVLDSNSVFLGCSFLNWISCQRKMLFWREHLTVRTLRMRHQRALTGVLTLESLLKRDI